MHFILHQNGTISVRSFWDGNKKHAMLIFDSEIAQAGLKKKAIENHLKRHGWRWELDRYSSRWKHPLHKER